ncbi:MAG TPA: hypothetical protein VGQ59_09065 [Cyclobacteriaceae bacterium]|jgi:hypothetical protein|nr:hypothetical protein [Cyclobacteriaceae bacterium]
MRNAFFLFFSFALTSCASTTGIVQGKLCYPSEYIPAMNVYLKANGSNIIYKLVSKENDQTFSFKKIPEGNYVAYAYTIDATMLDLNNKKSKASGGFSHFVPCGLSVDCKDHSLISFKVNKGKTTNAIDICDWYGAVVPAEK